MDSHSQNQEDKTLNLAKLKRLIETGVSSIPIDKKHKQAVLVIGDTGVGKTTILSFLARRKLIVKIIGLNTVIDSEDSEGLRIGHDRFSETTVPSKVIIDDQVFFDCSGFKDNRGEEYEISNSFFVQRLFDLYKNIKILLIVDESSITEARADKLPKLIRNLLKSFESLKSIQDGVIMLVNRAKPQYTHQDYSKEILKLASLKKEDYLFNLQERQFLEFLVKNNQVCLFKQAQKENQGKTFEYKEDNLIRLIKGTNFVKSKHIKNIISESAKLAIRHFMDHLANSSEPRTRKMCRDSIREITSFKYNRLTAELEDTMVFKQQIMNLIQTLKNANGKQIFDILTEKVSTQTLGGFQQDLSAVLFFQEIYDKSDAYFMTIKNVIISEFSMFIADLDKEIHFLQVKKQEQMKLQREIDEAELKYREIANKFSESSKKAELLEKQVDKVRQQSESFKKKLETLEGKTVSEAKKFEQEERKRQQQHKRELENLISELKQLRLQYDQKDQEVEYLKIENESLKGQIQVLESKPNSLNSSMISMASKTSKYPDVVCPHFKNGGKCKHCIKAWKQSTNEKSEI